MSPVLKASDKEEALEWIASLPDDIRLHEVIAVARCAWYEASKPATEKNRLKAYRSSGDVSYFLKNFEKIKGQVQFYSDPDDYTAWERFKQITHPETVIPNLNQEPPA